MAWPCYEVRSRSGHAADAENKRWRRPCALATPLYIGAPASSNQACGQPSAPTGSRCSLDCPKNFPSRSFLEQICSLHAADGLPADSTPRLAATGRLAGSPCPRRHSSRLAASKPGDARLHSGVVAGYYMCVSTDYRKGCIAAIQTSKRVSVTHSPPRPSTAYSEYGLVE